MTTRRVFLKNTAITTAGLSLAPALSGALTGCAPSDRINVGLIGCNGMGFADLSTFLENPQVECIGLCDIDDSVLNRRAADVEKIRGKKPANLYKDWRKLIANKDINVVIIGTPDHWHCLNFVDTLEAGKHAYIEKPIGNSIAEINIMQKAVQKHGKIVQVGQWQRSQPHFVDAINFVKSGTQTFTKSGGTISSTTTAGDGILFNVANGAILDMGTSVLDG